MNILIYVVSILMVLAAMSYSRLQTYRTFATMEASFLYFMKSTEGIHINKLYAKQYDDIHVQKHDNSVAKASKAEGIARLSLNLILNQKNRSKYPLEAQQSKALFKQLMITLYSKQKFFKDMVEKRPQFLDEIIDQLQVLSDNAPGKASINNVAEILRLEMPSEELHYTLFLMLEGLKSGDLTADSTPHQALFTTHIHISKEESIQDTDDEVEAKLNVQEAYAPPGYTSLYDFTSASKEYKLRVFLAHPVLLMAIYDDINIVNQIREMRAELYKQVHNAADPAQAAAAAVAASLQFQNAFGTLGNAPSYSAILNFAVTNSNPKTYEKN